MEARMRTVDWLVAVAIVVSSLLFGGELRSTYAEDASTDAPREAAAGGGVARARAGLLALYDFSSSSGPIVKDRSGVGKPVDLRVTKMKSVRRSVGSLEVTGETQIRSSQPASKIIEVVRRTGEITIEAWIRPATTNQKGPARIVTLSRSGTERNFTLGQDGNRFDVRFRTSTTSANGIPSVSTAKKSVSTELTHVVYTRDRTGRTRIYINGEKSQEKTMRGRTLPWHGSFKLALANEFGGGRQWLGHYYLVAVYGRDLLPKEIQQNFTAGADARAAPARLAEKKPATGAELFETRIAPLLARHCLECHDATSKKGRLDLSRKDAALAGGKNGVVIVPGNAAESLIWEAVEHDDMPKKRSPLSRQEKELMRRWIEGGAVWSIDVIDPLAYAGERKARENWLLRLTVPEYIETVRSAVGVDVEKEAREILPPDLRADGFSNTAYNLNVDLGHVEAYAKLAEIIVERMDVLAFAARYSKSRKLTDDSLRGLIAKMGQWILRGPLEEHEIVTFRGISTTVASAGGDFEEAVSYVLEAMLQSPRFIYRIENQRGDGTPWPVGDYELASRLSYILWGAPPDRELMKAAEAGDLYDRSAVGAQVRRMLEDPRAIARSSRFIEEWLDLERLRNLRPGPERFPDWNDQLAADMREETLAYFKDVVWKQKRPLADLLNAQFTYVTPRLAGHYGLELRGGSEPEPDVESKDAAQSHPLSLSYYLSYYDLASVPSRGGLLTQGSVLTVGGDDASMVARGLFVLHDLLRGTVKDPPPGLDTTPVPPEPGLSRRDVSEKRVVNPSCGGCHSKFEPLAFGLEKYDGIGAYHEKDEHGNTLREDGEILFPGEDEPVRYRTTSELMDLLAKSGRVRECITWKLTQFALGRPLVEGDGPILKNIDENSQRDGGTYVSLITAIVMSDLVQMTQTEPVQ